MPKLPKLPKLPDGLHAFLVLAFVIGLSLIIISAFPNP